MIVLKAVRCNQRCFPRGASQATKVVSGVELSMRSHETLLPWRYSSLIWRIGPKQA